jgi:hypothetical protein
MLTARVSATSGPCDSKARREARRARTSAGGEDAIGGKPLAFMASSSSAI